MFVCKFVGVKRVSLPIGMKGAAFGMQGGITVRVRVKVRIRNRIRVRARIRG